MRWVSLCRCLRPPASFTQGLLAVLSSDASLSFTASVTNSRSGMPRSAATDLARRKMRSGISSVVFTKSYSHIYGIVVKNRRPSNSPALPHEHGIVAGNGHEEQQRDRQPCADTRRQEG